MSLKNDWLSIEDQLGQIKQSSSNENLKKGFLNGLKSFIQKNLLTIKKSKSWIELIILTIIESEVKVESSFSELLLEICKNQPIFCPLLIPEHIEILQNDIINRYAEKAKAPKTIEQFAPKFSAPGDKREFNSKFELQKITKKKRLLEKKIGREAAEASRATMRVAMDKKNKERKQNLKRANQMIDELQKSKKHLEKEATMNVEIKRNKKVKKRRSGK